MKQSTLFAILVFCVGLFIEQAKSIEFGVGFATPRLNRPPGVIGLKTNQNNQLNNSLLDDARIDASVCIIDWSALQPTDSSHFTWTDLDNCITTVNGKGETAVLLINMDPNDQMPDDNVMPSWTARRFSVAHRTGLTSVFPIYWDTNYQALWDAVIQTVYGRYDQATWDDKVLGYLTTGYSGTLNISLAGQQTDALCPAFQARGYTGDCLNPTSMNVFSTSTQHFLTTWRGTHRPRFTVMQPVVSGKISSAMESTALTTYLNAPHYSLNNGCQDNTQPVIDSWKNYQLVGNGGGCFGVAVNFDLTVSGLVLMVTQLQRSLFVIFMNDGYWNTHPDVLNESAKLLH